MKFLLLLLLPTFAFSQSTMDSLRWYLDPKGQEVLISIDDLHDESLNASPEMNWGRSLVPGLKLQKDVLIAVIDGGIDTSHPELKDHIAYNTDECINGTIIPAKDGDDKDQNGYKGDCAGWDFVANTNLPEDLDGHGTHVSGIIRSVMEGVEGSFKFIPLKAFAPDEGKSSSKVSTPLSTRLSRAFEYAILRKADVIHLSVGWPKSLMTLELEDSIKKAISKGILVVAAAGNSSQRATIYPCQMEGVICVGALRPNGDMARFSNWGSQVDIFAPGEKILSTIPFRLPPLQISRKGYDYKNGTSQAAPFISGALGILKGMFPEDSHDDLYARLMKGANNSSNGLGLKGLFKLQNSLNLSPSSFVYPQIKGLHSVVIENGNFTISIPIKNFWKDKASSTKVSLTCSEADILNKDQTVVALRSLETSKLMFKGFLNKNLNYINCEAVIGTEKISLRLKVLNRFGAALKELKVKQDELLVTNIRGGARSRFSTLNPIKGTIPGPFYHVAGEKGINLYREDRQLGALKLTAGCTFLRVWQIDYDKDFNNEFMLESLCDKTHLKYQFLNQDLQEIYPSVKYKPTLTIINYEEFEVIPQKNAPPVFRFLNYGFNAPTDSPWDTDETSKDNHYYELSPVKDGNEFKFSVGILENTDQWMKSLGLRYLPSYQVLHHLNGKLLVKIGQKTAWVNLKDQSASWANLENVMLAGSRKQTIIGSTDSILQSFLTPFEYRGFILNGIKLRFIQTDKFDPFLDILGTEKNDSGYRTVIRSFQRLIYIQFDEAGAILDKKESVVDRFDFLSAQDLIASVVNLNQDGKLFQLVDGTKINTNYVDLVFEGRATSYEIPENCVTQNPIVLDGKQVLPLFCAKNRMEFEMKFISLREERSF